MYEFRRPEREKSRKDRIKEGEYFFPDPYFISFMRSLRLSWISYFATRC